MAKKEVPVGDYVWIDWSKTIGMIIGLTIAITSVTLITIWVRS